MIFRILFCYAVLERGAPTRKLVTVRRQEKCAAGRFAVDEPQSPVLGDTCERIGWVRVVFYLISQNKLLVIFHLHKWLSKNLKSRHHKGTQYVKKKTWRKNRFEFIFLTIHNNTHSPIVIFNPVVFQHSCFPPVIKGYLNLGA